MTDYTPTTGEMREWYVRRDRTGRSSRKEYELEFDRWLTQERAQAKAEALRDAARALMLRDRANKLERASND